MPTLSVYSYAEVVDVDGNVHTFGNRSKPTNITVLGNISDNLIPVPDTTATKVFKVTGPVVQNFDYLEITSTVDADMQITIDANVNDTFIQFAIKANIPFRFTDEDGWLNDGTIDNMTDGTSGKKIDEIWLYQSSGATAYARVVAIT
jgi:hypothetical protein